MKKALIVALSVITSVLLMFGIVACGDKGKDDAETVNDVIETLRTLYEDDAEETVNDYDVFGKVRVGDELYEIEWSVSSETANYQEYITIGEINPDNDNQRTVKITLGTEKVDYTLKATVTIGKSSNSIEFKHYIPAAGKVLSVAQALEIASKLEKDAYYMENGVVTPVLVKGYVVDAGSWSGKYLQKVYIADTYSEDMTKDSEGTFYVYSISKDDVYNTQEGSIEKGDLVTFKGPLQNYKGNTPELTFCKNPAIDVTVVALTKTVKTDAEKVDGAKEAVDLCKVYNKQTDVTLPLELKGTALSWAVKDTTDLVKIEDGKLKIVKIPAQKTEVKLTVTITSGSKTDTKDFTLIITPTSVEGKDLSVAEIKELEKTVASGKYYEENGVITPVRVKGYVVDAGEWSDEHNNLNKVYIADTYSEDITEDRTFYVYRIVPDGTYIKEDGNLQKGDLVTFNGYLQNFGGTYELTYCNEGGIKGNVTCIGLEKPGLTDAEKVAAAKEAVDISKNYNEEAEIELPLSQSGTTLSWTVKGTSEFVTVENNVLKIVKLPAQESEVTLTVTITSGSVSDTKDITIKVAPAPVEEKIYSVAEVKALAATLESGKYYEENGAPAEILVQGYVIVAGELDGKRLKNVFIADKYSEDMTKESEGTFLVYSITLDDTYLKEDGCLEKGDLATFSGYLQNYKGTYELTYCGDNNVTCVALEYPNLTDAQKVERALKGITLPETVTQDVELPGSKVQGVALTFTSNNAAIKIENGKMVVTRGKTDVTVKITATAKIGSETKTKEFTVVVKAPVVDPTPGETTLLAKFELGENGEAKHYDPTSDTDAYSETKGSFTLNVTSGTNFYTGARDAKGNSCFKLGTSKKTGSFTFKVDEIVTQVIVYVARYKTNKTSISVNGAEVTLSSEYASNDGNYYALVIDTTTNKEITISTATGACRCMINAIEIWG